VRSPTIRRLALIAFFLAAGGTHPLAAQTIDTIVVDNHNIFEPGVSRCRCWRSWATPCTSGRAPG